MDGLGSGDEGIRRDAWDLLARAYHAPVYGFIRLRWNAQPADAQDLTQAFFAHAFERGFLEGWDPAKARFRTWLRVCLQRFLSNVHRAAGRMKRGRDVRFVDLDLAEAERSLAGVDPVAAGDEDAFFRREAARSLFALAVRDLRAHLDATDRAIVYAVFERYDLHDAEAGERPTYRDVAAALDLPVTQVTNHLYTARQALRRIVLERLRQLTGSDAEFRAEARELLGTDPD